VIVAALTGMAMTAAPAAQAVEVPVYSDTVVASFCVNVDPVQFLGGVGSFTGPVVCAVNLPDVCVLHSDPDLPSEIEVPSLCRLVAVNGTYVNGVCGWTSWQGTAVFDTPGERIELAFNGIGAGGQGMMLGAAASAEEGLDLMAGAMEMVPTAPLVPPCPATQYRLTWNLAFADGQAAPKNSGTSCAGQRFTTTVSPAARARSSAAGSGNTPSWVHTADAPIATASSTCVPACSDRRNRSTTSTGRGTSASVG
jgi:hypothetical protein